MSLQPDGCFCSWDGAGRSFSTFSPYFPGLFRTPPAGKGWARYRVSMTTPLMAHTGAWTGTNSFRLMLSDPPDEAAFTADVSVGAKDAMVVELHRGREQGISEHVQRPR